MGDIAHLDIDAPSGDAKVDHEFRDRTSYSSDASTPDHDLDIEQDQDLDIDHDNEAPGQPSSQAQPQQQKRKGGRKPIYATSEERKQRNRQAQAAFRERRTEYIKQLENTIKLHEETLQNLQQSHRSAADECLMLRYKNSLLERILLEKGIDVQAELQAKTGSPNLGPVRGPLSATPLTQPIQRYAVNKLSQNRRSLSAIPKPDAIATNHQTHILPQQSPRTHPVATSHLSSPALSATKSPNFIPHNGPMSPSFGPVGAGSQQQIRPQPPLRPSYTPQQRPTLIQPGPQSSGPITSAMNSSATSISAPSSATGGAIPTAMAPNGVNAGGQFYPSPFQSHYDQLDQEYDAQAEYVDEHDHHEHNGQEQHVQQYQPASSTNFGTSMMPPQQPRMQQHQAPIQQQHQQQQQADGTGAAQGFGGQIFDMQDPMLDADPFGLSASMHFPTQFSFNNMG